MGISNIFSSFYGDLSEEHLSDCKVISNTNNKSAVFSVALTARTTDCDLEKMDPRLFSATGSIRKFPLNILYKLNRVL